ncbi:hypothetical protein AAVH_33939 [Aphelenchoides avenae]|nr:hypothetical protein AAVH_33939 [Aphelenchus avenae]
MGTLSGSQAAQAGTIYNNLVDALGGSAKAEKTFTKVLTVVTNNLGPLADQYMTKERVKTIMKRIKGKVTAAEWKAIRNQLTSVVLFAKHGL